MGQLIELAGQKFGRLTVLPVKETRIGRNGHRELFWLCKCDCGKKTFIRSESIRRGRTRSCGCLNDEARRKSKVRESRFPTPHNGEKDRLYRIYNSMKHRCLDKTNPIYGKKGISICEKWQTYEPFREWALRNGYEEHLSIDRIDNNKGYNPDNCRWVDRIAQANNMTTNHPVTYKGKTKNLGQWAREIGIKRETLGYRLNHGWTVEEAFNTPPAYGKANAHYK